MQMTYFSGPSLPTAARQYQATFGTAEWLWLIDTCFLFTFCRAFLSVKHAKDTLRLLRNLSRASRTSGRELRFQKRNK